jgi:exopolyphosphatase/guanosine-5'-triphosphate,3'-diphosphate pyrophosphatase
LGSDVFVLGKIGEDKFDEFMKLMQAFKIMIDLYHVDEYYACATSAMREAQNGQALADAVLVQCGLKVNIIDGLHEADLINRVIELYLEQGQSYLHIDVGGGSTELNVYQGHEKMQSKSFPLGTVRTLAQSDQEETWNELTIWIQEHLDHLCDVTAIGTGGNIRKLFELSKGEKGKHIGLKKLQATQNELKYLNFEDRMQKLQLNADRADVIIPAAEIYINIMKKSGANKILVPDVGLKDGIIAYLYAKNN